MNERKSFSLSIVTLSIVLAGTACTQNQATSPEEQFGFAIGTDYELINYEQLHEYWIKLASESDRMVLDTLGLTEEGRPHIQAIITSPENHKNIDRYREISRRMAKAEGVSSSEALELAEEGKAIVWIDGGLHATEVLGAHQLTELVYRMNANSDAETLRILNDVVLLATHANPDGQTLVSDWYMRHEDELERSTSEVPVLYNKYAGHDNNRDFYMAALAESQNMNTSAYRDWYPQILYNHHQTGPAGTVMFAPPFRDPPNHYLDPLIMTGLDQVGSAMHQRFVREGKGGTTMRSGASYSTWWNGGLRTTPYFKNMIGLLTETIGHPTPIEIPFIPDRQMPHGDLPLPVEPGAWHFRQSIEYSQTANWAVLDYASRNSDHLLYNIWQMGTNSIERGNVDTWTTYPFEIDALAETVQRGSRDDWEQALRKPEDRDPRGFIISSGQRDFLTATKFVNTLLYNGVDVHRATADFTVDGQSYPVGSYVVKTAQAFRPHVLDMFEKQEHPNDFPYPGAPPTAPYDNTGWTLAWQMGVDFDRILEGFDGPFEVIDEIISTPPAGTITGQENSTGYIVDHINDAFIAVNRVLAAGGSARWYMDEVIAEGLNFGEGAFYLEIDRASIEQLAEEKGLSFVGVASPPTGNSMELSPVRIGLWDQYGGSMPSGWTRMILEDFEFDFDVLYPPDFDNADLNQYDVLVFEDGAIPATTDGGQGGGPDPATIPEEFRARIGEVTINQTVPRILDYLRSGGAAVTIGTSTSLAMHAGLPISNHLVENGVPLTREKYFTPGSVLDMKVEHVSPLTHGFGERANVLFSHSPTFRLSAGADPQRIRTVGWYNTEEPLRSGWAWGEQYLVGGVGAIEADYGEGKLFIFGPKITFRAQPHGTFGFLFNSIYYGAAN